MGLPSIIVGVLILALKITQIGLFIGIKKTKKGTDHAMRMTSAMFALGVIESVMWIVVAILAAKFAALKAGMAAAAASSGAGNLASAVLGTIKKT
jgi:ABC-type phosphate transport system permease subunit